MSRLLMADPNSLEHFAIGPACLLDARGRITTVNRAFADRLGRPAETLAGLDLAQTMKTIAADKSVSGGAEVYRLELEGGPCWLRLDVTTAPEK